MSTMQCKTCGKEMDTTGLSIICEGLITFYCSSHCFGTDMDSTDEGRYSCVSENFVFTSLQPVDVSRREATQHIGVDLADGQDEGVVIPVNESRDLVNKTLDDRAEFQLSAFEYLDDEIGSKLIESYRKMKVALHSMQVQIECNEVYTKQWCLEDIKRVLKEIT